MDTYVSARTLHTDLEKIVCELCDALHLLLIVVVAGVKVGVVKVEVVREEVSRGRQADVPVKGREDVQLHIEVVATEVAGQRNVLVKLGAPRNMHLQLLKLGCDERNGASTTTDDATALSDTRSK